VEKKLILRGILAGAVAGVLAFIFARILAEPAIQAATDYQSARDAAQDALNKAVGPVPAGADIFSRTIQADVGSGVGTIAFGIAMGALFAVAYSICLGRVGDLRPRPLAILVASGGFLGLYLVPFLKYPANPPGVGHEETIRQRTGLYLIMVVCSLAFLIGAVWIGQRLRSRFGAWNATLLAGAAFIVAIAIVMALLPSLGHLPYNRVTYGDFATETPQPLKDANGTIVFPGFPADVLFNFRLFSVALQAILWTAIGLVFAPMAGRLLESGRRWPPAPGEQPVAEHTAG
jgi:hypothetical protein